MLFRRIGIVGLIVLSLSFAMEVIGQAPEWIWHSSTNRLNDGEQVVYFRKSFRTPPLIWLSRLTVAADDEAQVFLNGVLIAHCDRWDRPVRTEVTVRLNQGENALGIRARNSQGPAGLLVQLHLGGVTNLVSDSSWLVSEREERGWATVAFNAASWSKARSLGPQDVAPWGDVLLRPQATAADALAVLPGFKVELVRSAQLNEGSWICLAFDDQGRLLVSPEGDKYPMQRFTLTDGKVSAVQSIVAPVRYAMGLLYAQGSLYANARGPGGAGLYRLTDRNGNDQFEGEEMQLLQRFEGGSEHGYHALRLGPDHKLYIINGNGTKLPPGLSPNSPHRHYGHDVLSLNPDETTEAGREDAAQCHILRTDLEGRGWELWAGGMRNAYSFDFNPEGELFAFDSDMEWDWGTPWYRPIRVVHGVPGGDYGWRDGTRSWPDYYEDSLPAVVNVGIGSPTGVRFGTSSRFPAAYRKALFAMDWSYGRILAVHLRPKGASYEGSFETFLKGTPLNLTDLAFGSDGALYFITGGRATQSGLYRVTYIGESSTTTESPTLAGSDTPRQSDRALRRRLEALIGQQSPEAIDQLWPHLGSDDRHLRYAARIALESQPASAWKARALAETRPIAALTALLALARGGGPETQQDLLQALRRFSFDSLSEQEQLLNLRVMQISLLRQGRLSSDLALEFVQRLNATYPARSPSLNRELSRILIFLDAPGVVGKTLDLLAASDTQAEQLHYVAQLRHCRSSWTLPDRKRYLEWWGKPRDRLRRPPDLVQWFAEVGREYVDGAWIDRYLKEFRADALAHLTPDERKSLADLINAPLQKARLVPSATRTFVREWTLADFGADLDQVLAGRDLVKGRQAYVDAQCIACHRFGNDGGSIGPELTGASSRYDRRSLLESILTPSKVVSEQYQNVTIYRKSGDRLTGRIARQNGEQLVVETDPLSGATETIARRELDHVAPSLLSPMPEGLANGLTHDEVLDLLAYIESGARPLATSNRAEQ